MNAQTNSTAPKAEGMEMTEAAEYMAMPEQDLRGLLCQLGYIEAVNPDCQTVPLEYVSQLEGIKSEIDQRTEAKQDAQPEEKQLAPSADDTNGHDPQQAETALTLAEAEEIANAYNTSAEFVLTYEKELRRKTDLVVYAETYAGLTREQQIREAARKRWQLEQRKTELDARDAELNQRLQVLATPVDLEGIERELGFAPLGESEEATQTYTSAVSRVKDLLKQNRPA